ncbi:MAG: TetR/AcrR family transcriptional regulator [Bacteroidales bacterium]|nr:TetR/AcrR family transcriptional regulator [Bacteroidales bacterium]
MAPRTESEFEKLRLERKSQIMETALELFARDGYHQTAVSKIADRAGISKGLMYNYFASKEELLDAIITKGIDLFLESFDPDQDGTLTSEEFDYFVYGLFNILSRYQRFFRLYISVLSQPEALQIIKTKFEEFYEFYLQLLTQYFARIGSKNPEAEARLFAAMVDGIMFHFLFLKDYPLDEVKKIIINRFKAGIS